MWLVRLFIDFVNTSDGHYEIRFYLKDMRYTRMKGNKLLQNLYIGSRGFLMLDRSRRVIYSDIKIQKFRDWCATCITCFVGSYVTFTASNSSKWGRDLIFEGYSSWCAHFVNYSMNETTLLTPCGTDTKSVITSWSIL